MRKYNFEKINKQVLPYLLELCEEYLPEGNLHFDEYVALNPNRYDSNLGSFKINIKNGLWADFATDDKGCGVISLISYVLNISYIESAKKVLKFIGEQND